MTDLIRVDFACNDPNNGDPTGRFIAMQWNRPVDIGLEIVHDWYGPGLRFTESGSRIRVLRRWYTFVGYKAWLGNWCWDAYWMTPPEAKRLLRDMKASGKFTCEGGPVKLCDWWDFGPVVKSSPLTKVSHFS